MEGGLPKYVVLQGSPVEPKLPQTTPSRHGRTAPSPCNKVTSCPAAASASARAAPVAPVLTLETKRTASMGSRVAPEVRRTFIGERKRVPAGEAARDGFVPENLRFAPAAA
jgi:hypothetical protein